MDWYVPTFYGDLKLETLGKKKCRLLLSSLTMKEQQALATFERLAVKKKWLEPHIPDPAQRILEVPIEKASKVLAKLLKGGRKVVSAVIFINGKMEEIHSAKTEDDGSGKLLHHPFRSADVKPILPEEKKDEPKIEQPQAIAGVTVAVPVQGCPAPDFNSAEIRARRVLLTFLNWEQLEDFNRFNRFITVGAQTGHRYMITSRYSRDSLQKYTRTLYDLDDEKPLCVHDWDIPAAEEMLALHVLLKTGHEHYLRVLED